MATCNLKLYQGTSGVCYVKIQGSVSCKQISYPPPVLGYDALGSWKILLHWVIQTFWNIDLFSYTTSKKKSREFISPLLSAENHWSIGTLSRSRWWKPVVWNPVSSESLGLSFGKHTVSCFSCYLLRSFSGQCALDTPICMTFVCQLCLWVKTILREQERLFQLHTQSRGAFLWDNCCTAVWSTSAF